MITRTTVWAISETTDRQSDGVCITHNWYLGKKKHHSIHAPVIVYSPVSNLRCEAQDLIYLHVNASSRSSPDNSWLVVRLQFGQSVVRKKAETRLLVVPGSTPWMIHDFISDWRYADMNWVSPQRVEPLPPNPISYNWSIPWQCQMRHCQMTCEVFHPTKFVINDQIPVTPGCDLDGSYLF